MGPPMETPRYGRVNPQVYLFLGVIFSTAVNNDEMS
jgi:hypothetical protein